MCNSRNRCNRCASLCLFIFACYFRARARTVNARVAFTRHRARVHSTREHALQERTTYITLRASALATELIVRILILPHENRCKKIA